MPDSNNLKGGFSIGRRNSSFLKRREKGCARHLAPAPHTTRQRREGDARDGRDRLKDGDWFAVAHTPVFRNTCVGEFSEREKEKGLHDRGPNLSSVPTAIGQFLQVHFVYGERGILPGWPNETYPSPPLLKGYHSRMDWGGDRDWMTAQYADKLFLKHGLKESMG
ncbi:hypothetical protein CEXT_753531 [Caerostris extrusa]|uniref:Uncharacterized protein n=1 Tax=Caerostris extrusa TaxID=172846 RepID=A0AAV4RL20_CAEEX|nr:hypothetical protein CEXT_753531 [Caerostris extrusa]